MSFLGPVTKLSGRLVRPHDIEVATTPEDAQGKSGKIVRLLRVGFEVRLTVALEEEGLPEVEVTVTRATQRHLELAEGLRVWVSHTNGARSTAPIRLVNG
jgi:sulfate transport system ATP-binding protein